MTRQEMDAIDEARAQKPEKAWTPIGRCDMCDRIARWAHPDGGLRCDRCPRPERTKRRLP